MLRVRNFVLVLVCIVCLASGVQASHVCPKCKRQFGDTANYCLKDGTRLITSTVNSKKNTKITTKRRYTIKPGKRIGDWRINKMDRAKMMWVPAGEFWMGSSDDQIAESLAEDPKFKIEWYINEKPMHKVYLKGYWIYKNEVTVAQYRKFCTKTGRLMPPTPRWGWDDDYPIVNVTWQDAAAYAKWARATLPTEAQWEKAARGIDGRMFPWGNEFDTSKCNEASKDPHRPQPIGSYPDGVSPYGCMDMAGNVWEWCSDWYGGHYYDNTPTKNPTGPKHGIEHSLKGGSWNDNIANNERCARRAYGPPTYSFHSYGFRCARNP